MSATLKPTFVLDNRERELLQRLQGEPTRALPVGDVWIGLSGEDIAPGGIVAERKTAADLEASILDGRYREQRTRLTTYTSTHGARPLYIIEGSLDRLGGRLTEGALLKFLTRLTVRYGVPVLQTESVDGTARLIEILRSQLATDPATFVETNPATVSYASTVHTKKKENREDAGNFYSAVLQQCPGVSAKVAAAIAAVYPTFGAFWGASQAELAIVPNGGRKVGAAVAERLWRLFHGAAPAP